MNIWNNPVFLVFRCAIFMMFLLLVFNKTPVIVQGLSPPCFPTFRFCVVIFSVFLFFHAIWDLLQKTHVSCIRWDLGLPNLAITRAREGQSLRCFHVFGPRKLFSLFWWILTELAHILGTFFQIVRRLVVQCIGKTTTRRHNERRNDKTTTKRHNETTKWNERLENLDKERRQTLKSGQTRETTKHND